MAAVLKKRALAEYSQVLQCEEPTPLKKLRLVRRQKSQHTPLEVDFSKCQSSQELLNLLVTVSECLPVNDDERKSLLLKLLGQYHKESEAVVRVKIVSMVADVLAIKSLDSTTIGIVSVIDDLCSMLKTEQSHKVKAQILTTLHSLGKIGIENYKIVVKLINIAKQYLRDSSHHVQCSCLKMISELAPVDKQSEDVVLLVGEYIHSQESRVRCSSLHAMLRLHSRGFKLNVNLYHKVCFTLSDDYEGVRQVALRLINIFTQLYPEHEVPIPNSLEFNRLIDDGFTHICQAISDLSMKVRAQAAALLGEIKDVSPEFLEQTLDKKLMSNMRRKRSAHERQKESYQTGEWSSGKKWADDAPKEHIDEDAVNLMNSGTCGAFVHGLEDEFLEVRSASLDSLCALALNSPHFARLSLDYLVDMFNDEIEDVRLKAIHCLTKISSNIVLREDQLETMLSVLEDYSVDIREALHNMLSSCNLSTQQCLKLCVDKLLENQKRYPQDKHSIWKCLQKLGQNHPDLTLPLVPQLLAIHPFFDMPEPDVEDPLYISILILVFNAATKSPTMLPLLEEHTRRHYAYLRHSLSSYVPSLQFSGCDYIGSSATVANTNSTLQFLFKVLDRVSQIDSSKNPLVCHSIQETAVKDLEKLSELEPSLMAASHCACLYIQCQLLYSKILSNKNNLKSTSLPLSSKSTVASTVEELVKKSFLLTNLFGGLSNVEISFMIQMYTRNLALQLTYIVNTSNTSALSLCDNFLDQVEMLQRFLHENQITADSFTEAMINELNKLEDPKPGAVARALLPLFSIYIPDPLKFDGDPTDRIKEVIATIHEPTGESDNALKFTSGLVLGVNLDAHIKNIKNIKQVRVKIKYPDQQTQLILPRLSDFRAQDDGESYRLLTSVLLSHSTWSEACHIEINLVLDVIEAHNKKSGTSMLLDLCKPIKVYISPKPPRRGI